MYKIKNKLFYLLIFFPFLTISGKNYYFRHYTNENGLSHNTVYCSLQDQRGFIWVGTIDGLNRFDGHTFKIYRHEQGNRKSIRSNYITSLHEDPDGWIWIGTNQGLCYYNPQTDDFGDLDDFFLHEGEIGDIKTDFQANVWIQSFNGLYKYNKEKNNVKYYPAQIYFTPNRICISPYGDPWFTSAEKALFKYDYKNDTFTKYEILTSTEKKLFSDLLGIVDTKKHGLLIGTESLGLKCFNPNTNTTETFMKNDADGKPIRIRVILPYSDDEFFVGTESGLYLLNIETGVSLNFKKNQNDPYSIGDNAIYTLTKDTEGGLWIGTYFQGLSYLPNEYVSFEKFSEQGQGNCIRGNAVREIAGDEYGNIWIGTEDAGLNKYVPESGLFTHFLQEKGGISGTNLHGLLINGDSLWIGYYDRGVDVIDIKTNRNIMHFEAGYGSYDLKTNFVVTIYKTKDGRILLGTLFGVYQYMPETKNFRYLRDYASYSFVYAFCEDYEQTLWIATLNNGLFYRTRNGISGYYKFDEKNPESISSNIVSSVFEDSKKRIWVATRGNGFCLFHPETKNFTRFTTKDGLPSNFIYKILEDGYGKLWITTSNGLICFHPETKEIKRFSTAEGLTNNQFNYNSGYKDRMGKMYFGTINGMVAFVPENIRENDFNPPVYITGFQVYNEELNFKDRSNVGESVLFVKKITLPYDKSTFSIDFAALSYTSPNMSEYQYKLEGIDKQWTHLKTYRKAYYTNLSPGEYLFRLKANNGDGNWKDSTEKTLLIIIRPPFWKTTWAYLCYFILIGTVVYIILRFYTQRIKLQNQLKLEKMEDLKQQELLRSKIDFFTHIAHEIRTPLTLIKGPLDHIIKSVNDTDNNKDNLAIMQRNTDRLLDLTNQLMDFRKAETEGMRLNFIPTDIVKLVRDTYIRFTSVAKEKGLSFELKTDTEKFESIVDLEAVVKILSNLFTNALKFANSEIGVTINTEENNFFEIRVENDGKLIPPELKEKIFEMFFQWKNNTYENTPKGTGIGLYLGRLLAELHNGKLYLDDKRKAVNSFVLRLPQHQDIYIGLKLKEQEIQPKSDMEQPSGIFVKRKSQPVLLLVEDEKEMLDYVTSELSDSYSVIKAANGKEALNILDNHIVNLIISDINMPEMNGFELCRTIKSDINYSHIPFILLTARQNIQSRIEGLETGADAYIGKPFSTDHLLAQISNLLTNHEKLLKAFAKSPLIYSNSIASTKADEDFLKKLNDVIMDKLSDTDMTVEYLAGKLNLSVSGLYRKMRGICDMNPNEFIRLTRLKRAAELLSETTMSVKEVAYVTGFSTPSYFSMNFQKQFGMKPSDFVKRKQK